MSTTTEFDLLVTQLVEQTETLSGAKALHDQATAALCRESLRLAELHAEVAKRLEPAAEPAQAEEVSQPVETEQTDKTDKTDNHSVNTVEKPQPEPEPEPAAPAVTLEEVRAVMVKIAQAGKAAELRQVLLDNGVEALTEAKPEQYPAILAAAKELE